MNNKNKNHFSFENIILKLQNFWQSKGCILMQPIDIEVGAGTFHPATLLRSLEKKIGNVHMCKIVADLLMVALWRKS